VAELERLAERQRQPAERDRDAEHEPPAQRLVVQQQRGEHGAVERHDPEQHGRQPGRDVLLAPVDQPVRGREREQREHGRQARVRAQRPARQPSDGQQPGAREPEADPGAEQRRQVLEPDLDRDPRARPDQHEAAVEGPDQGARHGRAGYEARLDAERG